MSIRKFRPSACELLFWLGLITAIIAVVLAFVMPLRVAKAEIGGFPKRKMYLKKMTGFSEKAKPYTWYGEETCKHYRVSVGELSDPVTAASNEALGNASPTKFCSMFRGCRDIEALRCIWYKKVQDGGNSAGMMMIVGTALYAVACSLVVFRLNPRIIAAVGIIAGFVLAYGFLSWVMVSDAMINFQRTMVFVPYATLTGASKGIAVCALLTILAPLSALRMVDNYKEAPDAPPEEEADAEEAPAAEEEEAADEE